MSALVRRGDEVDRGPERDHAREPHDRALRSLMQPWLTRVPMPCGSSVPWMPISPSPAPNRVYTFECAEIPKAYGPYGASRLVQLDQLHDVVPAGVGIAARPTPPEVDPQAVVVDEDPDPRPADPAGRAVRPRRQVDARPARPEGAQEEREPAAPEAGDAKRGD
jgi:hypothetical protein